MKIYLIFCQSHGEMNSVQTAAIICLQYIYSYIYNVYETEPNWKTLGMMYNTQ